MQVNWKFIKPIPNNFPFTAKTFLNVSTDLFKFNTSDQFQFLFNPFLPSDPVSALQAATKQYVDAAVTGAIFPLLAPETAAGSPSYTFAETSTDTGMGSPSDGLIEFSNNGGLTMSLTPGHNMVVVGSVTMNQLILPAAADHEFFAGPLSGGPSVPGMRVLGAGDIPNNALPVPIILPLGVNTSPSIQFDSDTGIFSSGDGNFSIANNTVVTAEFNPGGITFNVPISAPNFPEVGTPNTLRSFDSAGLGVSLPNWSTQDGTGDISHSMTIVSADSVSVTGIDQTIIANPPVDVTGAFYKGISNVFIFDNVNAGFGNQANISAISNRLEHNGAGFIDGAVEVIVGSASFTNAGRTSAFRGLNIDIGVASGYTIDSFNNVSNNVNSMGGIFGGLTLYGAGTNLTAVTSGNINGLNTNIVIDGASVLSQGVTGDTNTIRIRDSSTVANTIAGYSSGITLGGTATTGGIAGQLANIQVTDSATSGHVSVSESDFTGDTNSNTNGVTMHQIGLNFHDNATGGNAQGINNGLSMDGASGLTSYMMFGGSAQLSGSASVTNGIVLLGPSMNLTGSGVMSQATGISMPMTIGGSTAVGGPYEGFFLNHVLNGAATVNTMIGGEISMLTDNTAVVSGQIAGLKISIQNNGTPHANTLQGIEVNLSGGQLSAATIAAGGQKKGLIIEDGTLTSNYNYTVPGATFFGSMNNLGGQITVAAGDPVVQALVFANNFNVGYKFDDDWGPDFTGIGLSPIMNGCLTTIEGAAGKTSANLTLNLSAATVNTGAGTITNVYGYRSAGVLPNGGTLAVTNLFGFEAMVTIGVVATNSWSFIDNSGGAENFFGKVAIGTSTKKVDSGYKLHVDSGDVKFVIGGFSVFDASAANGVVLKDTSGVLSIDSKLRHLADTAGATVIDWSTGLGFFTVAPVAQQASSGPQTAGVVYTATEQTMLQEVYNMARAYGLLT